MKLLAILLFPLVAQSQTIGIDLGSRHLRHKDAMNDNVGVYVAHRGWAGGIYRNSFNRTSVWAGAVLPVGPVDVTVGLFSGYGRECGPLLVLPSVRLGNVRITATPRLVHLSLEVDL